MVFRVSASVIATAATVFQSDEIRDIFVCAEAQSNSSKMPLHRRNTLQKTTFP
jgi:hypothetical protein